MVKLTFKIAIPIVLVSIFSVLVFVAENYDRLDWGFYITVLLVAVFSIFFGLAVGQYFYSPIKKMLDGATELSRGNLSSRVYLDSEDEFSELANALNRIAEELEENQKQQTNVEKSVSVKVQAKTKELEETINALEQKVKNRTIELEKLIGDSSRLQESVKNKQTETAQLKKDIDSLKQKVGRSDKPKNGVVNKNNL